MEDRDTDIVFAYSDKGWTSQVLGVEYLRLLFEPLTAPLCARDEWRLLIVDGHNSHFIMGNFVNHIESSSSVHLPPPHTSFNLLM